MEYLRVPKRPQWSTEAKISKSMGVASGEPMRVAFTEGGDLGG